MNPEFKQEFSAVRADLQTIEQRVQRVDQRVTTVDARLSDVDPRLSADIPGSERHAYHELCAYTLAHALHDRSFIHQHVVDAFAAQQANANSKPMGVAFALIGLYLRVEKHFSGKQVQHAHMALSRRKEPWPVFDLPRDRGSVSVVDVVAASAGTERDRMIDVWCASVWTAYADNRNAVVALLARHGIV